MPRNRKTVDMERKGRIHRTLAAYGQPMTSLDIATLLSEPTNLVYAALQNLADKGWAARVGLGQTGPQGGRPMTTWALTDEGLQNIPDPQTHREVGRFVGGPSMKPDDPTDFRNQPSTAPVVGETRRMLEERYPLLDALRNRDTVRASLKASALLLPPGDSLRHDMLAKADSLAQVGPLEEEYLRYATKHP